MIGSDVQLHHHRQIDHCLSANQQMNAHILHCIGEFLPVKQTPRLFAVSRGWHAAATQEQRMFGAEWKHQIDLIKRKWPTQVLEHSDTSTLAIEVLGMHDTHEQCHDPYLLLGSCDHIRWVPAGHRCGCCGGTMSATLTRGGIAVVFNINAALQ